MSRLTIKDPAKSKSSETFLKVLRFIGRYRFLLILSIILAAVSVILQLYVPILFGNAIDHIHKPRGSRREDDHYKDT